MSGKTTKRTLLTSVLALVMCVAMLVGTTFAWFTDTASTNVNKVQAGTLKVELLDTDGNSIEGQPLTWQKASGHGSEEVLWEPGCTYTLKPVIIKNSGNLALKYKVLLTATVTNGTGSGDISEVLMVTLKDGERVVQSVGTLKSQLDASSDGVATNELVANSQTDPLTISLHMKEEAGNEYQGAKVDNIAITVLATQNTVEYDSNGKDYDADAQYDTVTIVPADGTAAGAITGENQTVQIAGSNVPLGSVDKNGTTISGGGSASMTTNADSITANNVTIKDVTINGSGASGTTGTLNINGDNTKIEDVTYNGQGTGGDIAITVSTNASNEGTVFKNTTVKNAFRGIQFWKLSGNSRIENCTLDIAGYTFNIDSVESGATLTVTGSTLKGWTSYTDGISLVKFENCTFAKNTYQYLRPYSETQLTNCAFNSDGYKLNAGGTGSYTITLTNCTKNGTAITADNVKTLLLDTDGWNHNVTLKVNGTTVTVS